MHHLTWQQPGNEAQHRCNNKCCEMRHHKYIMTRTSACKLMATFHRGRYIIIKHWKAVKRDGKPQTCSSLSHSANLKKTLQAGCYVSPFEMLFERSANAT